GPSHHQDRRGQDGAPDGARFLANRHRGREAAVTRLWRAVAAADLGRVLPQGRRPPDDRRRRRHHRVSGVTASTRWFVLSIFVLSSTINYLDRQTLATVAPLIRAELRLSNAEYGWIVAAFSL